MRRSNYILGAAIVAGWICRGVQGQLQAQVLEVNGGNSSLYQAGGGSVTIHGSNYEYTLGAGTVDGHLLEGARMLWATQKGAYILGDERIDFQLPTDIFDTSHYLQIRGIGFRQATDSTTLLAFVGATSQDVSTPLFNGAKMNELAALYFLRKRLTSKWELVSDSLISVKPTQIEALQWTPAPRLNLAVAAGLGAGAPFGAISLQVARPRFDARAAYIEAGQNFHRTTGPAPLLAEPIKENVSMTVKPLSYLTLSGSRQNFLVPQYPNPANMRSSVDEGSVSLHAVGTQLTGNVYHSSYDQPPFGEVSNHAAAFSAMRDFGSRIHVSANYFVSKPKGASSMASFISSVTEAVNARISVTENVTASRGGVNATIGGEFVSNRLSFSASYQTFYVPAQNSQPFEQVLLLDVKLRVLGRLLMHGATYVDPLGRLRYTADANTVFAHNRTDSTAEQNPLGGYVMRGCVVDAEGVPVEGAALWIDQKAVYTDSSGCFSVRERRPRIHTLRVVTSEFLAAGDWQIDSIPDTISSTTDDRLAEATVILRVRRRQTTSIGSTGSASSSPSQKPE